MTKNFTFSLKHLTLFTLLLFFAHLFSANLLFANKFFARQDEINITLRSANLQQIFTAIEKQSGRTFSYNAADLNLKTQYKYLFKGSLDGALNHLSTLAGLSLKLDGTNIMVRVLPSRMIKGRVTNAADGTALPGVIIQVKDGNYVATSDGDGNFSGRVISNRLAEEQLYFRMIGMKAVTTPPLANKSVFNVELNEDITQMKDVIITSAYSPAKPREEVVGSITQITAKQLQVDRPIESFDKLLEGMVAGVYVEGGTELGTPVKINIRGQGSLIPIGGSRTTSSQPLFVIDGIPVQEQNASDASTLFNGETLLNPLAGINPANIASISILKDAAASTIYGANGANGVIIITTKSGKKGKTQANLSVSAGASAFINQMQLLSGPQYYMLKRETLINDGQTAAAASAAAGSSINNTNWLAQTDRDATYKNINLDLSGGSGNINYFFSAGYRDQQSNSVNNGLKTLSTSLKVNDRVSDKLTVGFTISPTLSTRNGIDVYSSAAYLPPNIAANDQQTLAAITGISTPLQLVTENENFSRSLTLNTNAHLKYKITPGLYLLGTIGANTFYSKQRLYYSKNNPTGSAMGGRLRIFDRNTYTWLGFLQAGYEKTFAEKHSINVIAGFEAKEDNDDLLSSTGNGFTYDKIRELGQATTKNAASSKQSTGTVSYYTQASYDFQKKYFITASARVDESSIFGGDKQSALNAAAGLGWVVTKEDFLQPGKVLNYLRARASFGSTGNSRIGSYASRGLYNFSAGNYNGEVAATPLGTAAPNPDLGWEKNYKLNFGIDLNAFNFLRLTAEYYRNTVKDLISNVYVPLETGYSSISVNTATMRNQGFEFSLDADIVSHPKFSWTSALNFGLNGNRIISLNEGFVDTYGISSAAVALKAGYSTTAIWGVKWAGIDPQTGAERYYAPDGSVVNRSAILALGAGAWQVIGDRLPDFQGGMVNRFQYKDLSLTVNFQYSQGADFLLPLIYYSDGTNIQNTNMSVNLLDRWRQPGDVTEVAKLSTVYAQIANSSRYVYNLSYIKLSNVTLNYRLPEKFAKVIHTRSLSAYINATNLAYFYADKSEQGRNGIRELRYTYPETRTISAGLNIGF